MQTHKGCLQPHMRPDETVLTLPEICNRQDQLTKDAK